MSPLDSEGDAVEGNWTLEVPAWSSGRGFPATISFHGQRLGFAGTAMQPLTVWQSEIGEYERYGASALADASLDHEFGSNQLNLIIWMEPFRDLLVGTASGEHLLRGVDGPLTPTNGEQLPLTSVGAQYGLKPIRHDNALLVLQRGGRQVKELVVDEVGQVQRGIDHTLLASHITESGIIQWAMQTKPMAILWAVRADGALVGFTYEQVEEVRGWHRHVTPNGFFESVCVVPVPSPTNQYTEDVYVVVRRIVSGQTRRFVEKFDPMLNLDCAITYNGAATATITGLDHLDGEAVTIVDRSSGVAAVLGETPTVAGGQIALSHTVTLADIGLPYTSRLKTMRPEIPIREGTIQGRKKRWINVRARLRQSVGLTINGKGVPFRTPEDLMDTGTPPADRDVELTNFGWDEEGYLTIEQLQPLPSTILALYGDLEIGET
jgi:hypothetical protein